MQALLSASPNSSVHVLLGQCRVNPLGQHQPLPQSSGLSVGHSFDCAIIKESFGSADAVRPI
jgi:hypothetical protein